MNDPKVIEVVNKELSGNSFLWRYRAGWSREEYAHLSFIHKCVPIRYISRYIQIREYIKTFTVLRRILVLLKL